MNRNVRFTFDSDVEFRGRLSGGIGGRDLDFAGTSSGQRLQRERRLAFGGLDDDGRRSGQRLVFEAPLHLGRRNAANLHRDDDAGSGLQLLGRFELCLVVNRRRSCTSTTKCRDVIRSNRPLEPR